MARQSAKSIPMILKSFQSLALMILCVTSSALRAQDISSITQYPVSGKTAVEVYEDIKAHAPRVAQNATFAFTMIATKTDEKTTTAAKTCRYSRFKTSAIYNFVVPKHQSPAAMSAKTQSKWMNFVAYLKTHEQGHRSIWQNCLLEYDTRAIALSAKTCDELDAGRAVIFAALKRKCLQQDEAYDVTFRKAVLREPFVAQALRGN
jgi:predicted secreted Zn-dependent protease